MDQRPVLVYDGECGFCLRCVRLIERWVPTSARMVAWQDADLEALGTSRTQARHELVWAAEPGQVYGGAQAIAHLLLDAGRGWAVLGFVLTTPPVRWMAHLAYRVVAANRRRLSGVLPAGRPGTKS